MTGIVKLGDEASVSDTDPRMLRVVELRLQPHKSECEYCALRHRVGALQVCGHGHPLECTKFTEETYDKTTCAVFVDEIPLLAVKGILA